MTSIRDILQSVWGHKEFRPLQEDIIQSVLAGKNTLALLPTGGGKSVCFQVPTLMREGLCVVVSPLIALMKDQVENLRRKNITALAIYSGMTRKEVINTLKVAADSNCKFLYVSPERLETTLFREYLPLLPVTLIAVDEAHCISQWGYDFRPAYLRIQTLRASLPGIPVLALTASATTVVQEDICRQLEMTDASIFRQSFERPNLSYSVFRIESKIKKILEILTAVKGSAIIYCKSRKRTTEFSNLLNLHQHRAGYYHAGLERSDRDKIQQQWLQNEITTIVCTNAFGMGIDKPDVRIVIHADIPDCLENYYQEAGRAGRDSKKAYAVLLIQEKNLKELNASSQIRFPDRQMVLQVYEALMNYFQLPRGNGEGLSFDFEMADFCKKFKIESRVGMNCLKALEEQGFISVSDQFYTPSSVQVLALRETIAEIEKLYPDTDLLLKTLLRTYEGIFDQPVPVYEKMLASLLRWKDEEVVKQLYKMDGFGFIRYIAQKEKPQVFLLQNREKVTALLFDESARSARKKLYESRVGAILDYVAEKNKCRSRMIGNYFGDNSIKNCGVCDNCLQRKSKSVTGEEFQMIHSNIVKEIRPQPLSSQELFNRLGNVAKEKAWEVIQYLEAENKIMVDDKGMICLR
ncbi:MAG TPA: ATP-dependent DNA helicase RecQ [Flavitalea sp.]|nr:ATP-dependent DNA helicase RecQ [Flavitalea sp.]